MVRAAPFRCADARHRGPSERWRPNSGRPAAPARASIAPACRITSRARVRGRRGGDPVVPSGSWGGQRPSLGDYATGTGPTDDRRGRRRKAFVLACMKRLAVSRRQGLRLCLFSLSAVSCQCVSPSSQPCLARLRQPCIRARQGRVLSSPAHEGSRRVGAPSKQRPCDSGQVNTRAHPRRRTCERVPGCVSHVFQ